MRLSAQDVRLSIFVFAALGLLCGLPLALSTQPEAFQRLGRPVVVASMLFWGTIAVLLGWRFWDDFYRYFYPDWMKPLMPMSALLYGGIGFVLWRLSTATAGSSCVAVFLILGGLAGVLEHLFAIEALGILEKVPMLQDLTSGPILVFSFFEYAFYWSAVAWLSKAVSFLTT